jgi:hypothetical protein
MVEMMTVLMMRAEAYIDHTAIILLKWVEVDKQIMKSTLATTLAAAAVAAGNRTVGCECT